MNDAEVTRFLGCIQTRPEDQNVACVDAMEAQARQSNPSFNYWQPDAQTNRCLAPLRSPPSWARQIEEEVTRTHQCPQSFTSIYQLTQFAMDQKRRSYDTRRFPSPGTYTICGYNNTNFNWFRVNLTVVNENQFYHQDAPGYPNTCLNYQRIEPDRSTFIINGPACHSGRSYRQGGSLGDTELIPLTSNVWIIIHLRPDFGIYFAGLVFR